MGSRCVICNVSIFNSKKANVCDSCLNKIIERYKDIMYRFAESIREKYAEKEWFDKYINRINDNKMWEKVVSHSDNIIINKEMINCVGDNGVDTYKLIIEFLGIEQGTQLIYDWNIFLGNNKALVIGSYYNRCSSCGKINIHSSENFITQDNSVWYCMDCYIKAVYNHQNMLLDFLRFLKTKILYSEIDNLINYYSNNSLCLEYFIKNPNFHISNNVYDKHVADNYNYSFLYSLTNNIVSNEIFYPLWNDFLRRSTYRGTPYNFAVINGCKRCAADISCSSEQGYDDYLRIKKDPNVVCHNCKQWINILNDLRRKYGWNPSWRNVLIQFEEYGIKTRDQANPKVLYRILKNNNIEMSEEIVNYWNSLYQKYSGDRIIKLYAIPEGVSGEIQQEVGRLLGGLSNSLSNFFNS